MALLKDYPTLKGVHIDWTSHAKERGHYLRQANRHVSGLVRWIDKCPWGNRVSVLLAAQMYTLENGLPARNNFIQLLSQMFL